MDIVKCMLQIYKYTADMSRKEYLILDINERFQPEQPGHGCKAFMFQSLERL